MGNTANLTGKSFETLLADLFGAQGFVCTQATGPMLEAVGDARPGRRLMSQISCPVQHDADGTILGRQVLDLVILAEPGHYNPAMFPGHDPTLPITLVIEAKQQTSAGSADEKLVAAFLKLSKLPAMCSHKLLVTHTPAAGKGALADLEAIYRGQGILRDTGCEEIYLRANPVRHQWVERDMLIDWLPHAFPMAGDANPQGEVPSVYRARPV